jgi:hypothetical protein
LIKAIERVPNDEKQKKKAYKAPYPLSGLKPSHITPPL